MALEKLLSPDELVELLGIPKRTIYNWRLRGEGPPAVRVGRHLRYRPSDVEAWLRGTETSRAAAL